MGRKAAKKIGEQFAPEIRGFVRTFCKELASDNAAVFAGAGLSVASGHVDWAGLMREIADDLGLDVDREENLIAIAQFHYNERRNRTALNRRIIEEFSHGHTLTRNHEILARLPIKIYWTTNYDRLIETALERAKKTVDVKYAVDQLKNTVPGRQAVIYKMHGDVSHPEDAILTKDDYEGYFRKHELFVTTLAGHLVEKTFLFLGFSFSDPNIDYVLSRVRVSLRQSPKQHYCIMRREQRKARETAADFDYRKRRQTYFLKDLDRVGVQALLVDDYSEITKILEAVERQYRQRSVFISGSAHEFGKWKPDEAAQFIEGLAEALIKRRLSIVTGFGLGVGSYVVSGAYRTIRSDPRSYAESQLIAKPFPSIHAAGAERRRLSRQYREELISTAGVAIFMFGNKREEDGSVTLSPGVQEEFDIAKEQGSIVLPIGATGYMAHRLWETVRADIRAYYPKLSAAGREAFEALGKEKNIGPRLILSVLALLDDLIGKRYGGTTGR